MQSDGGLSSIKDFNGYRAILSGPAGGTTLVIGHLIGVILLPSLISAQAWWAMPPLPMTQPIISLSSGSIWAARLLMCRGISPCTQPPWHTLITRSACCIGSRFDGIYEHVFETVTAGVAIQAPQLDINTVAAGGGSILFFRSGTSLSCCSHHA